MAFETLDFTDRDFWTKVDKKTSGDRTGHFKTTGKIAFVAMRDTARMEPVVRTKHELWETTVRSQAANYSVIVNAQQYDLTKGGYVDVFVGSDPVAANDTLPIGQSYQNGKRLTGAPAPNHFYVAFQEKVCPSYLFGFGVAPSTTTSAIGGAGPIIVNGRRYANKKPLRLFCSRWRTGRW